MSTIKTLTIDGATVNVESGKCQWNVKTASKFRSALAKWHNADFELAEELNKRSDAAAKYRAGITTNRALLEDLKAGKSIIGNMTEKEINAEIEEYEEKIEKLNAHIKEFRTVQQDRFEKGYSVIPDSLYPIYKEYAENLLDPAYRERYYDAIAEFLYINGVTPADETINALCNAVGQRSNINKNKFKTVKHNGANAKTAWKKIFIGLLCDIMGDALPLFKFKYVPMSEREKDKKNK